MFSFHKPETLKDWLEQPDTLRARLRGLPPLDHATLRTCQIEAIDRLEASLADDRPKSLIQMATGTGKTYTMVTEAYRLIKYGGAKRVLFLVDRRTLGRQALGEFQNYVTPVEHKKFSDLYNVQLMTSPTLDPVAKVVITTIQRMYGLLAGVDVDDDLDEGSLSDLSPDDMPSKEVGYNPAISPETFDFIVTDEFHRSIYGLWLQVLEYFDSHLIGLTATPSKQTLGFFDQNLVMEYTHDRAVADGVNVGYDIYRIKTEITEGGSTVDAGNQVQMRDKQTRQKRWELVDEDLEYQPGELDRSVVAMDQIRTIIQTFRDKVCTDMFLGRKHVPKTLVFAKDDSHTEDITRIILEEFGKGNTFCQKITYRTTGDTPENLIKAFRNSFDPRIAVTVDMISTGTDIRPLECLLFMRDVKSQVYYEQMKGRGTRVIDPTDLKAVTPDTEHKTHFVLVDAVGVTETDKTDSQPLERKRTVSFEQLLNHVAIGARDADTLTTLAGRLARLDQALDNDSRGMVEKQADRTLKRMANDLLDAVDPDKQVEHAQTKFGTDPPTEYQVTEAAAELAQQACQPFNDPDLRNLLLELKRQSEQTLDHISQDQVLYAGFDTERAERYVTSFRQFIEDNKDELTALQIIYSSPRRDRHVTFQQIKELADAIGGPPHYIVPGIVWQAYQHLDQARVKNASPKRVLTDIISLVRFATGAADALEPYPETRSTEGSMPGWLHRKPLGALSTTINGAGWP